MEPVVATICPSTLILIFPTLGETVFEPWRVAMEMWVGQTNIYFSNGPGQKIIQGKHNFSWTLYPQKSSFTQNGQIFNPSRMKSFFFERTGSRLDKKLYFPLGQCYQVTYPLWHGKRFGGMSNRATRVEKQISDLPGRVKGSILPHIARKWAAVYCRILA